MAYKVVTQRRAEADILEAYLYIVESGAPVAAPKWYSKIRAEIELLSEMPARFALAPEAEKLGFELRQVHVGRRSAAYRIVYRIVETRNEVHVLAVRHGARRPIELKDLS